MFPDAILTLSVRFGSSLHCLTTLGSFGGSQRASVALQTLWRMSGLLGSSDLHQLCNVLPLFFLRQPLVQPVLGVHQ